MKRMNSPKRLMLLVSFLILVSIFGCEKNSVSENDIGYGCDTKVVLKTLTNTTGQLKYSPEHARWIAGFNLSGGYLFLCDFCDQNSIKLITAGHSNSDVINITVSGEIKRRVQNQPEIIPTTGYPEIYLISAATVN